MDTDTESLHGALRRATACEHEQLDRALTALGFFEDSARYTIYVRRFLVFQHQAEGVLERCRAAEVIPDWSRRRKVHLLRADLAALGVSGIVERTPETIALSPRPEHVLGATYVLEGSTLGGAVLLKQVARIGVTAERGGSFLASYGEERGRMWRDFLAILASWEERPIDRDRVVEAARATFNAAQQCLAAPLSSEWMHA